MASLHRASTSSTWDLVLCYELSHGSRCRCKPAAWPSSASDSIDAALHALHSPKWSLGSTGSSLSLPLTPLTHVSPGRGSVPTICVTNGRLTIAADLTCVTQQTCQAGAAVSAKPLLVLRQGTAAAVRTWMLPSCQPLILVTMRSRRRRSVLLSMALAFPSYV